MESEQTPLYVFSNVILYLFMLVLAYKGVKSRDGDKFRYMLSVFLMFLFCEYAFWGGDYFHYIDEFNEARLGAKVNLEPFYYWLVGKFSSYDMIRLVIWGSALVMLLVLFRIIKEKSEYLVYAYMSTYFIWFTYARASLAMMSIILGIVLLAHENKKFLFFQILGVILLISSFSFHKSAIFGVVMGIMSLSTYRFGKIIHVSIVLSMVLFLYFYGDSIDLTKFVQIQEERMNNTINVVQFYFEDDERFIGLGELLEKILFHLSVYMIGIIYIISILEGRLKQFPKYVKILGSYAFWTSLISSVLLLDFDVNTLELYERFSMYALIPGTVFLWYVYDLGYKKLLAKITFFIAVISTIYTLSYSYYCALVSA